MDNLLPILIPSAIAAIVSIIAAILAGRRSKESNSTDAFEAVTAQLFKLNTDLRADVETLKREVAELRTDNTAKDEENAQLHHENASLHEEVGNLRDEVAVMTKTNTALLGYAKKLVRMWPLGTTLPIPDEPVDLGI